MSILISGYYGFGNEGDELILEGMLHALAPWRGQITVLSRNPQATQERHRVRAASRWQPAALWRELHGCRVLISGGGGLVQDLSGPFSPAYYLGLMAWAQRLGKRTVAWGQGFVPLAWAFNRRLTRRVLGRADLVIPRDLESAAWCLEQGLAAGGMQAGSDLVWLRPWHPGRPGKVWAICLRADWLNREAPAWLAEILALAKACGRSVRFVALGNRGDQELLARLRQEPAYGQCAFVSEWRRPESIFAGAELVLSQRYHGLILGSQAGAVVTGFGQDPKISRLLRELGQPDCDAGRPAENVRRLYAGRQKYRRILRQRQALFVKRARLSQALVQRQLRAWGIPPAGH